MSSPKILTTIYFTLKQNVHPGQQHCLKRLIIQKAGSLLKCRVRYWLRACMPIPSKMRSSYGNFIFIGKHLRQVQLFTRYPHSWPKRRIYYYTIGLNTQRPLKPIRTWFTGSPEYCILTRNIYAYLVVSRRKSTHENNL